MLHIADSCLTLEDLKALKGQQGSCPANRGLGLRLFRSSGQLTELFPSLDEKMLDEILPDGQAKALPQEGMVQKPTLCWDLCR